MTGWNGSICGLLVELGLLGLGLRPVSDTSDRPGQQEVMLFGSTRFYVLLFAAHLRQVLAEAVCAGLLVPA